MDFFGFIGNLKTHEMEIKMREEREALKKKAIAFKVTPSSLMKKNHRKTTTRTLPCSLEKWARCSTRKVDKATSEEEGLKEDLKRKGRKRVHASIAKERVIYLQIAHLYKLNLQEHPKEKEGNGGHVG